jgi:hypothetical protein
LALAVCFALGTLPAKAQDQGAPDSIKLALNPISLIGTNLTFTVVCSVFVDVDSVQALAFGWNWDNASIQMDSVSVSPRFDSMEIGPFFYLGDDINYTNDSQTAVCSGVASLTCFPPAPAWRHLVTYYLHSSSWNAASAVNVDTVEMSGYYGPATEYLMLPPNGTEYNPVWGGPQSFSGCCIGTRGDVNLDGTDANVVDLNYLVNYIFRNGPISPCATESDVNASGGIANIVDLNYIVNYIFRSGPLPLGCI